MLNVSQHSQENTLTGVSFLINIVVACNLSLSLFKKRFWHWCFPDSYLKFLTTTFLKREKKALLWEKNHCYKKCGSDIYRKSTYATFFVTLPRFPLFQQGVSTVYSDNRMFYQSKKITESSKSLTIEFWQSLTSQNSHWADLIVWNLCNAPTKRFISWVFLTVPRLFYQIL